MDYTHTPVLLHETLGFLNIKPNGIYIDGTLGGAGHAVKIAERLTDGLLIGLDQDKDAIAKASERLVRFGNNVKTVRENFFHTRRALELFGIEKVDGILLDLGVSSYQLDEAARGFSYQKNAPLDMRMDNRARLAARQVVNTYDVNELTRIFFSYGEERYAKPIARAIVRKREEKPIETTFELAAIIKDAIPKKSLAGGPHPAKRVFQAIRIEVNQELMVLEESLNDLIDLLNTDGRICVIAYHSLEDRIVKQCFRQAEHPCVCPPKLPCVCGKKPRARMLTKKPVLPGPDEVFANHRARSAKLRVAEKIIY